jgi:hypothetical protein
MKRPSIVADVLTDATTDPMVLRDDPKPLPPRPKQPDDLVRTSIYISRESHERLREIAFSKHQKIHGLIVEGIDLMLRKHGHFETAKAKPGATRRK